MTAIEFLHFEVAQSSMDIMAASAENMAASSDNMAASVTILGGHSNLKRQKFIQKWTKTRPIFDGFAQFLYKFLSFETSKDVQRGCHDVFRVHGFHKKLKFVEKSRETAKNRPRLCSWKWAIKLLHTPNCFLHKFWLFENALTSEDNMTASVDIWKPQNPKIHTHAT